MKLLLGGSHVYFAIKVSKYFICESFTSRHTTHNKFDNFGVHYPKVHAALILYYKCKVFKWNHAVVIHSYQFIETTAYNSGGYPTA